MANSPVPLPTTPNINLYNGGSEWQNLLNNMPDYNQTFYRNYDPAIGRFIAVDPMADGAESLNVYQYAGNNPVMMNDPMGNLLDPARLSHPANNPPIIPAPNPNAWGNDGPGNDDDSNWMNDGAFDTAGPFSSDGGLAGGAFWNDYTSSWNSILSGTGFEVNNTGAVMNNNAGRDAYLSSLYSNANGTRIFDFDANGNLTGNTLDEDAGPGGIIASMDGQGIINLPTTLALLGFSQNIDISNYQDNSNNNQATSDQSTDEASLWPGRTADYTNFDFSVGIPSTLNLVGWNISLSVDRYNNWHFSPFGLSFGKSAVFNNTMSTTANWLTQRSVPDENQLNNFLNGIGVNGTVGYVVGATASWSPYNGFSSGIGTMTPQFGISANWTPSNWPILLK